MMKHAELFNNLEKHDTAILGMEMPGRKDVWHIIPRPSRLRYVGVVNRRPLLPNDLTVIPPNPSPAEII